MSESVIITEKSGSAAIIKLNRPDKRNALNRPMVNELRAAFEQARDDASIRSVILTGAGKAFCAGMDLAELSATLDQPNETQIVREDATRLSELYDLIYSLPKPTIAAINGAAVAGGAGLMTVCDMAIAAHDAKFGYPEVRRGLVASMVMPHLLRHVGERAARELLLVGELIDADRAKEIGLINAVAESEALMDTAQEWAAALAESGPGALAQTKALLDEFGRKGDTAHYAQGSADARLTVECKDGLRAFFDKRPVPWV